MVILPFDGELLKLVYIFYTIPLLSWWPSPTTGNQCWSTPPTCRCASTLGVDSFEVPAVADLDAINQCNLSAKLENTHNSTRNRRAWCSTHLKHICQNLGVGAGFGVRIGGSRWKWSRLLTMFETTSPSGTKHHLGGFTAFHWTMMRRKTWENTKIAL